MEEIPKTEEKTLGSICCERCGCSFHLKCEDIKNPEENEWFCSNWCYFNGFRYGIGAAVWNVDFCMGPLKTYRPL